MNFKLIIFGIFLCIAGLAVTEARSDVDCTKLNKDTWEHSIYANSTSYEGYINACKTDYALGLYAGSGASIGGIGLALFGIIHGILRSPKLVSDEEDFVCSCCNMQFGYGYKEKIPKEWNEKYTDVCKKCFDILEAGHK